MAFRGVVQIQWANGEEEDQPMSVHPELSLQLFLAMVEQNATVIQSRVAQKRRRDFGGQTLLTFDQQKRVHHTAISNQ